MVCLNGGHQALTKALRPLTSLPSAGTLVDTVVLNLGVLRGRSTPTRGPRIGKETVISLGLLWGFWGKGVPGLGLSAPHNIFLAPHPTVGFRKSWSPTSTLVVGELPAPEAQADQVGGTLDLQAPLCEFVHPFGHSGFQCTGRWWGRGQEGNG